MRHDVVFVQQLLSILEKQHVIAADMGSELQRLFKKSSKESFDAFLLEEGFVQRTDLLQALSQLYNVPAFDVVGAFFDHELLRKFPQEFLINNCCIPSEVMNDEILIMIVSRPDDETLYEKISVYVSYFVQNMVGIESDIIQAIEEFYDPSLQVVDNFDFMDEEQEQEDKNLEELANREEK